MCSSRCSEAELIKLFLIMKNAEEERNRGIAYLARSGRDMVAVVKQVCSLRLSVNTTHAAVESDAAWTGERGASDGDACCSFAH